MSAPDTHPGPSTCWHTHTRLFWRQPPLSRLTVIGPRALCCCTAACCRVLPLAACTLSAIHFLTAAASVMGAQALGLAEKATMPLRGALCAEMLQAVHTVNSATGRKGGLKRHICWAGGVSVMMRQQQGGPDSKGDLPCSRAAPQRPLPTAHSPPPPRAARPSAAQQQTPFTLRWWPLSASPA